MWKTGPKLCVCEREREMSVYVCMSVCVLRQGGHEDAE